MPYNSKNIVEAASAGDEEMLIELISSGANINAPDESGYTALCAAAEGAWSRGIEILLAHKANPNTQDRSVSWSPLMHSVAEGCEECAKLLIEAGADLEAVDDDGWTALFIASNNGDAALVKFLLSLDANHNAVDRFGRTPSDLAREHQAHDVVEIITSFAERKKIMDKRKNKQDTTSLGL